MRLFLKQIKNISITTLFISAVILVSCKKQIQSLQQSILEKYFSTYVIGSNFTVTLAKDSSDDITNVYDGDTFVLLKTDLHHGPLKAVLGQNEYMGTWATNDDYSKLDISLPDSIPKFRFLSRSWRFTKKTNPTLELAPWGSSAPVVLYMTRQ